MSIKERLKRVWWTPAHVAFVMFTAGGCCVVSGRLILELKPVPNYIFLVSLLGAAVLVYPVYAILVLLLSPFYGAAKKLRNKYLHWITIPRIILFILVLRFIKWSFS